MSMKNVRKILSKVLQNCQCISLKRDKGREREINRKRSGERENGRESVVFYHWIASRVQSRPTIFNVTVINLKPMEYNVVGIAERTMDKFLVLQVCTYWKTSVCTFRKTFVCTFRKIFVFTFLKTLVCTFWKTFVCTFWK